MKNDFEKLTAKPVYTISNGYDEDDVSIDNTLDEKFSLVYTGYLVSDENPEILWQVLGELVRENESFAKDLELKFIGKVDMNAQNQIEQNGLKNNTTYITYQPHSEIAAYQRKAQLLLLLLNDTPEFKRILTGKMFEYLSAKRPVICIGSYDGDAAEIIRETNSGVVFKSNDKQILREKLLDFYNQYKQKNLHIQSKGIESYSRKNLTKKLSEVLNSIINK